MKRIIGEWLLRISVGIALLLLFSAAAYAHSTRVEVYTNGDANPAVSSYANPGDAWNTAYGFSAAGRTVKLVLGSDWSHDMELALKANSRIEIDLNGHYIKRNRGLSQKSHGGVFYLNEGATLVLRDSNPKIMGYDGIRGGVVTGGASSDTAGAVHVKSNAVFIMEGGTIYECTTADDGGAVQLDGAGSRFTMTGGRIYYCQTINSTDECSGGGLYVDQGTAEISNAIFDSCYSEDYGGAIFSYRGAVTLNNVHFCGNRARNSGGAIYIGLDLKSYDATCLTASDCLFTNNNAGDHGGAVGINDNADDGKPMVFRNCTFRMNHSDDNGGAVWIDDTHVVLSDVTITGNSADGHGGGVYVDSRYDVTLKGLTRIEENRGGKDNCHNLTLQDGISTRAYVYNAGLYEGSRVGINSTSAGDQPLSKKIAVYQAEKYYFADAGTLRFDELEETVSTPVYSSIFGNGSTAVILGLLLLGLLVLSGVILTQRIKKRKATAGKEAQ